MFKELPHVKILLECFSLDHDLGVLTWKKRPINHFKSVHAMNAWNARYSGSVAGKLSVGEKTKSYAQVSIFKSRYYAHRVIYSMLNNGIPTGMEIDHINGNGLDNRISNLRLVKQSDNAKNHRLPSSNTSGVCGVRFEYDRQMWLARITINKKMINLGRFKSLEKAISARKSAEIKNGFHENHGQDRPL